MYSIHGFINSNIHLLLAAYYMSGTVLGTEAMPMNKTGQNYVNQAVQQNIYIRITLF